MKILIIGAGKMGEAVLKCWLLNKTKFKKEISVVEVSSKKKNFLKKKYPNVGFNNQIPTDWNGDLVLLSIKPQIFLNVAKEINSKNIKAKMFLSIMAGISLKTIEKIINSESAFFRAMPNLASSTGKGVTGVFSKKSINTDFKQRIEKLLSSLGWVYWIKSEKLFDPLTAISGSGPAYIFLFLKIIIQSAKKFGFSDKVAHQLTLQTFKGSLEVLNNINNNLEVLISDVASKGGTTEAA